MVRIIVAGFRGLCRQCNDPIMIGQSVEHEKGRGVRCMRCVKSEDHTPAPQPAKGSSWQARTQQPKPVIRPRVGPRTYHDLFPDDD